MRAVDLFKQQPVKEYRRAINPPYKKKDVFAIVPTLLILFVLPLTVITVLQVRDPRNRASEPPIGSIDKSKSEFVSNEILIKVKTSEKSKVKKNPKPEDTGLPSLDKTNKENKAVKFQKVAKESNVSGDKNSGIFQWYKVTLPDKPEILHEKISGEDLVRTLRENSNSKVGKLVKEAIKYQSDTSIESVQLNYISHTNILPNDTYIDPDQNGTYSSGAWGQTYNDSWPFQKIGMESMWNGSPYTLGKGVTVAVIDSGVDYNHEDLSLNIYNNTQEIPNNGIDDDGNGYIDDIKGWDFTECFFLFDTSCQGDTPDNDPLDDNGHGTHVAGTIAARVNNGKGMSGVSPNTKILPIKAINAAGVGTADWLAAALHYAADSPAKVINNSWGCGTRCPSNLIEEEAVSYASQRGKVIVFASGNSGDDVMYYSPQNRSEVILAGASGPDDKRLTFSSYGWKVDVTAPGGGEPGGSANYEHNNILSTRANNIDPYCSGVGICNIMTVGDKYYRLRGTSMAAPHVSGLAANVLSYHPEYSPEDVRQVIKVGANDIETSGNDIYSGAGRIYMPDSVYHVPPARVLITSPSYGADIGANPIIEIRGSATASGSIQESFANYTLSYGYGTNPTSWTQIISSNQIVIDGVLGTWNTQDLTLGTYLLKLTVQIARPHGKNDTYEIFSYVNKIPSGGFTSISSRPTFQYGTNIQGDNISWAELNQDFTSDIYVYNISSRSERRLTHSQGTNVANRDPVIWGNKVIWTSYPNLYLYDLSNNSQRRIADTIAQDRVSIWTDKIVWVDSRNGQEDLYLYDLSTNTEKRLTNSSSIKRNPHMWENKVVWQDGPVGSRDINLLTIYATSANETKITDDTFDQAEPHISGNKIVWHDERNGNWDIFLYDLTTREERQITNLPTNEWSSSISANKIVYQVGGEREGSDIRMYDLTTNSDITLISGITTDLYPIISGKRIVWTRTLGLSGSFIDWDTYLYELPCQNSDTDGDGLNGCQELEVGTDPTKKDSDGDKCPDNRELGSNPLQGGMRDPLNRYDYLNPSEDGMNRVDDILAVVNQYFSDDPPGSIDYGSPTDRTSLGLNAWNLGPPNGLQRVDDILAAVQQYFHDCSLVLGATSSDGNVLAAYNLPPLIRVHDPDVTNDGLVRINDIQAIAKANGKSYDMRDFDGDPNDIYDLNADGQINTADVAVAQGLYYLNWPMSNLPVGKAVSLYISGLEVEGEPITYSVSGLPTGAKFTNPDGSAEKNRRLFTWTPNKSGNYTITFKATSAGQTSEKILKITVI